MVHKDFWRISPKLFGGRIAGKTRVDSVETLHIFGTELNQV